MNEQSILELLRKRQGERTQRDLAVEIGISPPYLSDVLRGNRRPSGKILEFLGIERAYQPIEKPRKKA